MNTSNKKLQVWWVPQVPGEAFTVSVTSVTEGVKVMDVLAEYDKFQLDNNIKPDYCNTGGLNMFEGGEWVDWCDDETGEDDPREFIKNGTHTNGLKEVPSDGYIAQLHEPEMFASIDGEVRLVVHVADEFVVCKNDDGSYNSYLAPAQDQAAPIAGHTAKVELEQVVADVKEFIRARDSGEPC